MLTDFLITQAGIERVTLPNPCLHLNQENRTAAFDSTDCPNPKLAPLYKCPKHSLCSPFAPVKDKDIIQACVSCDDYANGEIQ